VNTNNISFIENTAIIRAIKEDEMGEACGTYGKNVLGQGSCGETKWQTPHRRYRINKKIIFKWASSPYIRPSRPRGREEQLYSFFNLDAG